MFRALLQRYLQQVVRQRLTESVRQAATSSAADAGESTDDEPFDLAILVSEKQELAGLIDRLRRSSKTQAAGFTVHTGYLNKRRVAVATAGSQPALIARVTDALLLAYRPRLVVAAGFAAGLASELEVGDALLASRILGGESDPAIRVQFAAEQQPGWHVGTLLTTADLPPTADGRRTLGTERGALAADKLAWSVARVCRDVPVPMMTLHVVTTAVDSQVTKDVAHLRRQRSLAGKAGALLGGVVRRPAMARDLWRQQQDTWQAGDTLADLVTALLT